MIDTLCAVETPEGVELEFSPAGPVPRALAWLADAGIRASQLRPGILTAKLVGVSAPAAPPGHA